MRVTRTRPTVFQRLRRTAWVRLIALCAALFVAVIPVTQAFCDIELPAGPVPAAGMHADAQAGSPSGDGHPDPCCEPLPAVLASSDASPDNVAKAVIRVLGVPIVWTGSVHRLALHESAWAPARLDATSPPEPRFRRLKRLLV